MTDLSSWVTIENFCASHDLLNLVNENTCFKGPPECYDLILTNCRHNFQNTAAHATGFSDFHKMTVTVLKTEYTKADPIQINYRDYKKYDVNVFRDELKSKLNGNPTSSSDYNCFENVFL